MAIEFSRTNVLIEGVKSISVSEIESETGSGVYVRKLMIYTDALNATNRRPVLEIELRDTVEASLEIETPTLSF